MLTYRYGLWSANVEGGNGNYTYSWNGIPCTGSSCTIDPAGDELCVGPLSFYLNVSDDSGLCSSADSETESYEKVTTVTASDNE